MPQGFNVVFCYSAILCLSRKAINYHFMEEIKDVNNHGTNVMFPSRQEHLLGFVMNISLFIFTICTIFSCLFVF
jgi:hypothetical protein